MKDRSQKSGVRSKNSAFPLVTFRLPLFLFFLALLATLPLRTHAQILTYLNTDFIELEEINGGAGSIYPSTIEVTGLTSAVYKVTVTLRSLTHTFPDDIDALLIGPGGQNVMLLSDCGLDNIIDGITLTFDDTAASLLPDTDPALESGTYRPSNYGTLDLLAAPAPPRPYGTRLNTFTNLNPNGTWSLYLFDDAAENGGYLADGWSLHLHTVEAITNLRLTQTPSTNPVALSSNLTYTYNLNYSGPSNATGVRFTNTLHASLNFVSATTAKGACAHDNGAVICLLNDFTNGEIATITVTVVPTLPTHFTNTATVRLDQADSFPADNTTTLAVEVQAPPVITQQPLSQTVTNLAQVTFASTATGTAPLTYQWQRNDTDLPDATNATLHLGPVTPVQAGRYRMLARNRVGLDRSAEAILAVIGPPTLTDLPDVEIDEDTATAAIPFTVTDAESPPETILLTGDSSDHSIVPPSGITFGGNGAERTVRVTPRPDQYGTVTIIVRAEDTAGDATTKSFPLTIHPINDPPTLDAIPDQRINGNVVTQFVTLTGLGTSRLNNENNLLTLTARTADTNLIRNLLVAYPGSGSSATLTYALTPLAATTATNTTITVTVDDNQPDDHLVARTFTVTLHPPPLFSTIDNYVTQEDFSIPEITFTVMDAETPDAPVEVTASSSDPALFPNAGLVLGGAGTNRTLTIFPATNAHGITTITLTATDTNGAIAQRSFFVTIQSVNDIPTLSALADQTVDEDTPTPVLAIAIADQDDEAGSLVLTGVSDNLALFAPTNFQFSGSGAERVLVLQAQTNQSGLAIVTLTLTDPSGFAASNSFLVTVLPVNDPPTLDPLAPLLLNQGAPAQAVLLTGLGPGANDEFEPINVTAETADTHLITNLEIDYPGDGSMAVLEFQPAPSASGTATITVIVDDGQPANARTTRTLVVAINPPPSFSPVEDIITAEDTPTSPIAFTVTDAQTPASNLLIIARSSNLGLIPNEGLVIRGEDTSRTITLTPAAHQHGTSVITLTTTNATGAVGQRSFLVIVQSVNDLPTLSDLADPSIDEDAGTGDLSFTVSDVESPAESILLSGDSSNHLLVLPADIVFGGTGSERTVRVTPRPDQYGSVLISVRAEDPEGGITDSVFQLTIRPLNDPPTLDLVPDRRINGNFTNQSVILTGLGASSAGNENDLLTVTAVAADTNLFANPTVHYPGSGSIATLTFQLTPLAATAATNGTITVTVDDGQPEHHLTTRTFTVTIHPPPLISTIDDFVTQENTPIPEFAFTVVDAETPEGPVAVTASSSNPALLPSAGLVLGGAGTNRTLTVFPATNAHGNAIITLTATDTNGAIARRSFLVTVQPVNSAPTLSILENQTINEDEPTSALAITLADSDGEEDLLMLSGESDNPVLLTTNDFHFSGSGASRTLILLPQTNQSGTATLTVTVTDPGGLTNFVTFTLTVQPVPDAPQLSLIGEQTINEDSSTPAIPLTVLDPDPSPGPFTWQGQSDNPSLLAASGILLGGGSTNRTLTLRPLANQYGVARITLRVTDASGLRGTNNFQLTVLPINDQPILGTIPNLRINGNVITQSVILTGIGSSSAGNENDPLTITAQAGDTNLIVNPVVTYPGSGSSATLTFQLTPLAASSATNTTLTVTVDDGQPANHLIARTFTVTIHPPPVFSAMEDVITLEEIATPEIAFTVMHAEFPSSPLVVTASSSNPALIRSNSIVLGGTGTNRTLSLTPATNAFGSAVITLSATDTDGATGRRSFVITVLPVPDAPSLSGLGDQTMDEDTATDLLRLLVSDPDGEEASLVLTGLSDNPALFDTNDFYFDGDGSQRTLLLQPRTNQSGSATLTLILTDPAGMAVSNSLLVTVRPVIDPVILVQPPQSRTVLPGANVEFNVVATSTLLPLHYQWQRRGIPLPGATNSTFALTNLQPADADDYNVVIANADASTASVAATLRVHSETLAVNLTRVGNLLTLSFPSVLGLNYTVQYKNSLEEAEWISVETIPGTGGLLTVPDLSNNAATRFYRVRED